MAFAESPLADSCSIKVPDHDLLRLIGKGSYGEVWLARNIMGTYRAVKIIRRSAFDSDSPFDRELAGIKKFEPISRTHSGFVDILQIGRNPEERCLYYVMEAADDLDTGQAIEPDRYIPRTLGKALSRVKRFSVEECVQMGLALCQALDHLHRNGLVHRDIKPSNIVFVNGVPKLADIGLVTESNNAHSFVGTEGFIPPEGPGSEQADIYSLGKALYEIASGRDRLDFPSLPPGLSEFPDGDQFLELNECLIRACRVNSGERYASAREMYEDLALLASGKSLRRLRVLERRWTSLKKTTGLTAAGIAAAAMIIWPVLRERQHADEIRERQIGVRSANGIHKLDEGDLAGALGEFSEIFQLEVARARRFSANQIRVASILANTPRLTKMLFLDARVSSVAFGRNDNQLLTVEKTKRVQVHELGGAATALAMESNGAASAAFSPDKSQLVVADENGFATVWDLRSGQSVRLPHSGNVMCARFSPSGRLIATGSNDRRVRIWDAASKTVLFAKEGHTGTVRSVAFSPDEKLLVSTGNDETARLWDVTTGDPVGQPMRHPTWVFDAAFSPDSTTLVTGDQNGWAHLWKVATCEELPTIMKHDDMVSQVAYSPDGSTILTASNDSTVRLWNSRTTMPLPRNHVLRHSSGVFSAAFNATGHLIATGAADGTVRIWDLAAADMEPQWITGAVNDTGTLVASIKPGAIEISPVAGSTETTQVPIPGKVAELALSANGRALAALVASNSSSGVLRVWGSIGNAPPIEIPFIDKRVTALKFSPDGSLLALRVFDKGSSSSELRVFDASSGQEWDLANALRQGGFIAFHPLQRRLAIGSGATVAVYADLQATPVFTALSVPGDVRNLAFSADGRWLLVAQSDDSISPKSALLVDAESGQPSGGEFWHRDGVLVGAFQSNGSRLITGGEDRDVILWDIPSRRHALAPFQHRHHIQSVAFSPEGRWIGTASADGATRIWDGETGFPLTPPLFSEKMPSQIIFLSDKRRIATIQTSTRACLWTLPQTDMSPEDAIALSHLLNSDLRIVGKPDTQRIAEVWSSLNRKFPERFLSDKKQVARWHERQHRNALSNNDQRAMAFHHEHLRSLTSDTSDPPTSTLNTASSVGRAIQ